MENKNINTAKALPASASAAAEARKAAETSRCYKNRKPHPEISCNAIVRNCDFSEAGNLGRMSIQDVQAIFGTAAAERLVVSRMTADDGSVADDNSLKAIRRNLVASLLAAGYIVTDDDYSDIMDGAYYGLRNRVIKSGKTAALDAIDIACEYERAWERKREMQIIRGARAYREDRSFDKIATGAAVAYMAANAAAVAASIVKAAKKLAK